MLTPKETGGNLSVYPFDVEHSALLSAACVSTGSVAENAAIALSFKPVAVDAAYPLCDPTNHYMLLIAKTGASAEVFRNGASLGSFAPTAATYAELLSEAIAVCCGSVHGYYSDVHVVDGSVLPWETFFALSSQVADLWIWKDEPVWETPPPGYRTGDRAGRITVTTSDEVMAAASGPPSNFVDGDDGNDCWFIQKSVADKHICFRFAGPTVVTEARLRQSGNHTHGTWVWQGSDDGVAWADISEQFDLGGATTAVMGDLGANAAAYTYYRMRGVAGYCNATPYLYEVEFREQAANPYGPHGGRYAFADGAALGTDSSGNGNHWTVAGTQSDDTPTHNGGVAAWAALDEPAFRDTSRYAEIVLRAGTGTDDEVASLGFSPDWVNTKRRDGVSNWVLKDRVRGDGLWIRTNNTNCAEYWLNGVGSFTDRGYTTGVSDPTNGPGGSLVDLCLKADPWAGFAVVTYAGDGVAGRRIAHGLGRAPAFMVVKRLNAAADWRVYHAALGAAKSLILNTTSVVFTTSVWHGVEPDSTHFTVGSTAEVNGDGSAYVAYLFADSDVFRAFSYVGNGSTDGPVVDVGGRPLAVPFLKNTADTQMWVNLDAARDPVNPATRLLHPNGSDAEDTSGHVATYSSGMKITTAAGNLNGAGKLFVGLAVLRQPFKYSNAF